jgi:hypothetical protein
MPKKRFSAEQIVTLLRQIEIAIGQGKSAQIACREAGGFGTELHDELLNGEIFYSIRGGPWFAEWQNVDYGDLWIKECDALQRASSCAT